MSGIFGFANIHNTADATCLHALKIWNKSYGSDGSDTVIFEKIGAGCYMEHLSDEISCSSPVINKMNIVAVVDAIIYNREEIISLLKNVRGNELSDEELILELIQEEGYPALAKVNGDFAGAVYDRNEDTWTLFRDHLGVRPLFYYYDDHVFLFSTDMRGILAVQNINININEEKLYLRMMGYNDLSLCDTEFEEIHCIHPASWVVVRKCEDAFSLKETIYWKLGERKIRLASDEAYQKEMRRLVEDAIRRRLEAVPGEVGGELSGGLDSSVIAILMSRLGRKGKFYSWSFTSEELPIRDGADERKIIQDICQQEDITCQYSHKGNPDQIDSVFDRVDPPYLNTRFIGMGAAYLKTQGVKAVFTGHGGDEGVSHRSNLFEIWYHHEYKDFVKVIYRSTKGLSFRILRTIKKILHQIFVVHPYFRKPFSKKYINTAQFLNKEFIKRMESCTEPQPLYFAYDPVKYIMQGGTRVRLDNVAVQGAENGVRYMIPFLDYRVIDFAVSIPRKQHRNEKTNRYIFRQAFDDIMPQSLRDMHYKDTPSQREYYPDFDVRAYFKNIKEDLLQHLDRAYWDKYLDIKKIESLTMAEQYTWDDCTRMSAMLNALAICGAIQNVRDKAGKLSREYE